MNYYRISLHWELELPLKLESLEVTSTPVWVQTDKELDIHTLFDQGILVKPLEEIPETNIRGEKIEVQTL